MPWELVKQAHKDETAKTKADIRQFLREFVGCSGPTSYSYDERLYAPDIGPLLEDYDRLDGSYFVRFWNYGDYNLTVDELVQKYPKEGQRFSQPINGEREN